MQTFMRFPGGKSRALTLSYDDGVQQDIRLIDIMNKNGIKGTFNFGSECFLPEGTVLPAGQIHRRLTVKQAYELYHDSGHEVAVHGATHPFLEQLPTASAMREVLGDREGLEKVFGGIVRGMAYPFGTYNDDVVEILRLAGIAYARTTAYTHSFAIPTDWLRLPATCHHSDPMLMELADKFLNYRDDRGPALFYLWGHSYEFEQHNNWNVIEDFCAKVGNNDSVWYATNIEIYDYVKAYGRLEFNVANTVVHNPTAVTVWLKCGEIYEIPAGATVELK
ncbi:MAG: polysaccharide deacetylase family protein [Clostridia bacterium]|nr:polysaccharide deacetylase family protein [Clostridia bacterium]